MERANELIQKYLDGIAGSAEMAELTQLLRVRADVADAFASATRLDSLLSQQLGESRSRADIKSLLTSADSAPGLAAPMPPQSPPRRFSWRWTAMAAALLLSAGVGGYLLFRGQPDDGAGTRVVEGRVLVNGVEAKSIPPDARVQVIGGQDALLRLPDGSKISMASFSSAVLHGPKEKQREQVEFLSGEAQFVIAPGQGSVRVDTIVAEVMGAGASFTLDLQTPERIKRERLPVYPDWKLTVSVTQGQAEVRYENQTSAVAAGESRTFTKQNTDAIIGYIDAILENPRRLDVQVRSPRPHMNRTFRLTDDVFLINVDQLKVGQLVEMWMMPDASDTAYLVYVNLAIKKKPK